MYIINKKNKKKEKRLKPIFFVSYDNKIKIKKNELKNQFSRIQIVH